MDKVAIVILNWNGLHHLKTFLPSVLQWSREAKIYVADNNSTDGSVEHLIAAYPAQVSLIRLARNEGFSKGYNMALERVKAEYYILLNSDVEVTPDWLSPLISFLDVHPEVGACQPKIKSYMNNDLFEYAGAGGGYIDKFGFPFCRGRLFGTVESDQGQYDDSVPVFWASGACLVIRSDIYWQAGGLDNDFFAHMEEIDLCWRIQRLGYQVFYIGRSCVYHLGGGTLPTSSPHKTYLNFRNGLYLLFKNLPGRMLIPVIFLRMCLDGLAAFKFLFCDSPKYFFAVGKAHLMFYLNLTSLIAKRYKGKHLIPDHPQTEVYPRSVVVDYFVKKIKVYGDLKWKKSKKTGLILHEDSVES